MKVLKGPERLHTAAERRPNKTRTEAEKLWRTHVRSRGAAADACGSTRRQWLGGRRKALCSAAPNNAFIYPTVPRPPRRGVPAPLWDDSAPPGRQKETRSGPALQRGTAKVGDRFMSLRFPREAAEKQSGSSRTWVSIARARRTKPNRRSRRAKDFRVQPSK